MSRHNGDTSNSLEDERALEILKRTTRLKDGRYEVGLLWKNDNPELPNKRMQADKRLHQLKRRLQRIPEFGAQYKTRVIVRVVYDGAAQFEATALILIRNCYKARSLTSHW